eukprot:5874471-Alexandrium_andersonii.AAC.1
MLRYAPLAQPHHLEASSDLARITDATFFGDSPRGPSHPDLCARLCPPRCLIPISARVFDSALPFSPVMMPGCMQ